MVGGGLFLGGFPAGLSVLSAPLFLPLAPAAIAFAWRVAASLQVCKISIIVVVVVSRVGCYS